MNSKWDRPCFNENDLLDISYGMNLLLLLLSIPNIFPSSCTIEAVPAIISLLYSDSGKTLTSDLLYILGI